MKNIIFTQTSTINDAKYYQYAYKNHVHVYKCFYQKQLANKKNTPKNQASEYFSLFLFYMKN